MNNYDQDLINLIDTYGIQQCSSQQIIQSLIPLFKQANLKGDLQPFGSLINGFATKDSDADLVFITQYYIEIRGIIYRLKEVIEQNSDRFTFKEIVFHVKVPLIKFYDKTLNISIDLSFNNVYSIINSKLIFTYQSIHPKIRQLGILLKHWTKQNQIYRKNQLTSYPLLLLMIHYLQQEYYIPYLQDEIEQPQYNIIQSQLKNLHFSPYFVQNKELINQLSQKSIELLNNTSLIIILKGFFKYYHLQFPSKKQKVTILKQNKINNTKNPLSIVDPFNDDYDPGNRYLLQVKNIQQHIQQTYQNLDSNIFSDFIKQ